MSITRINSDPMPLRDHFHSSSTYLKWEALHGGWPMIIAQPSVRLGDIMEVDIAALERQSGSSSSGHSDDDSGSIIAAWEPLEPNILLDIEFPEPSEYEVNIRTEDDFRLVAAIELVSPSNKDRPENRKTFVNKCEAHLKKDVSVTIIDLVTSRTSNLYGEIVGRG